MKTNRDLYKAIEALIEEQKGRKLLSLEGYLGNLDSIASRFFDRPAITLEQFFSVLRDAFEPAEPLSLSPPREPNKDFQSWRTTLLKQTQDLAEMAANGQLNDDQRYFGINAPSGRRWYNFDPCTYLECGTAGAIGGWEEGDGTGRFYVPGEVGSLDETGEVKFCDPRELARPPEVVPQITWEMFSEFLWCGQSYE